MNASTMPIHKAPKKRQPLWKEWDSLAQKKGVRSPVYAVNGDVYTGEWLDNKKHGKMKPLRFCVGVDWFSLMQERGLRCGREMVRFTMATGEKVCVMGLGHTV